MTGRVSRNGDSPEPGRIGYEIELLAPQGATRRDLAEAIAQSCGGRISRVFLPQGEPSKAKRTPFFENLTLGFEVRDGSGMPVARCVDDLTLQDDLDRRRPPVPGWYRIVSDEARLLRLVMAQSDPEAPIGDVLRPVAALFVTELDRGDGGMFKVSDAAGAPVAIAAPLPGERERPCELVTAPLGWDSFDRFASYLSMARSRGFTVPAEGATHLHFDGEPLSETVTFVNLARFLLRHGESLKRHFATNPRCRRLGQWPEALVAAVEDPSFGALRWEEATGHLQKMKLSKYCDFNVRHLVHRTPGKFTFEVRILPSTLEADEVAAAARTFSGILHWARSHEGDPKPVPDSWEEVV